MTQFNGMISTMEFKNQKNLMPEQVNLTEIYGGIYIYVYYFNNGIVHERNFNITSFI